MAERCPATMEQSLTFLMGKFPAVLPADLRYARNHMWCRPLDDRLRFGFSSYAVRLMQDVYFLDWHFSPEDAVELLQEIGLGGLDVADLFAPIKGVMLAPNAELLNDPSPINVDNYASGWIFEMRGDAAGTLTAAEYYRFLDENWEKTQRTLKGHM